MQWTKSVLFDFCIIQVQRYGAQLNGRRGYSTALSLASCSVLHFQVNIDLVKHQ